MIQTYATLVVGLAVIILGFIALFAVCAVILGDRYDDTLS